MLDHLRALADSAAGDRARHCVVREYLQARVLGSLQAAGVFTRWAFVGGTALRFLYRLPRFSEDLDFSLLTPGEADLTAATDEVRRALALEGYPIEAKLSAERTVATAMLRFAGLPYLLGLSPHHDQVLSIKLEVDTNPPAGAVCVTTLVRRHLLLHLCHHDRASLLAGKLHAVLCRPWTKGRDLYDLAWYLADPAWPAPNLTLLNAALAQTAWPGAELDAGTWRSAVAQRLDTFDWPQARADVLPFLESDADLALVDPAVLRGLLLPA